MAKKIKKPSSQDFEKTIKSLEDLISKMESGKLSLEESINSFETGVRLTNQCRSILEQAQQKIQILMCSQEKKYEDFNLSE